MSDLIVIGGSISGLATALFASRYGLKVKLLEQDPNGMPESDKYCLSDWKRRKVPQFGLGHAFHGLGRRILNKRVPDVLQNLLSSGALERNFSSLIPSSQRVDSDNELCALLMRRSFFEWHLKNAVLQENNIEVLAGCRVVDIAMKYSELSVAKTIEGEAYAAPLIVDAMGRSSLTSRAFRKHLNQIVPLKAVKIPSKYAAVHFQFKKESNIPKGDWMFGPTGDQGFLRYSLLPEDNGHFVLTLNITTNDIPFNSLSQIEKWMKIASSFNELNEWIHPSISERKSPVYKMANIQNQMYDYTKQVNFDRNGVFSIGDALCVTNPTQGWGMSLALLHAHIAVEGIVNNKPIKDIVAELDRKSRPWFDTACSEDEERERLSKGEASNFSNPENPLFSKKVAYPNSYQSIELLRAVQRRIHLFDHPDDLPRNAKLTKIARQLHRQKKTEEKFLPLKELSREKVKAYLSNEAGKLVDLYN